MQGRSIGRAVLSGLLVAAVPLAGAPQSERVGPRAAPASAAHLSGIEARAPAAGHEFQFVRLQYQNYTGELGGWRRRESWRTDAPEAETHLLDGLSRLTRVRSALAGVSLAIEDAALFEHPFLYAVEVGRWSLSDAEAARMREYLLRGGLLVVDDFHGSNEWAVFQESLRRVFPERPVIELADDHPIFHLHFDVDHKVQIPSIWGAVNGQHWERDGFVPQWRAVLDDDGRVMIMINYNMDLGDAWEHADSPQYPQNLTVLAYHFGVNYVLYAMTH